MDGLTFEEIYTRLQTLYKQGDYSDALILATESLESYPEQSTVLDYWRMTMAARTGDTGQALQVLRGALEGGQWYSEQLLRRSPSFKILQGEEAFEALILQNQAVAEKDQEHVFPVYTLRSEGRCQAGGDPCKLLIGLHANASTVHTSMGFWRQAATAGWLVAAVQSSQAIWKGAYVWDDRAIAEKEIQRHYATLEENYAIDPRKTTLAGHSLGGEVAIWMALKGSIPARGFLAIGPGGPWLNNLEQWQPLLRERESDDLRGYILVGEDDPSVQHDNIQILVEWLNRAGVRCGYESVVGVEHDYTPDYDPAIQRGLEFIT
jgi:predicted esterase